MAAIVKGCCQDCLPARSLKDILWNSCDRKHEPQQGNTVFGAIWLMAFSSWGEQCWQTGNEIEMWFCNLAACLNFAHPEFWVGFRVQIMSNQEL